MKKHPVFFKLTILGIVILTIFAAINLVWYFGVMNRYNNLAENLDKTWDDIAEGYRYKKEIDGYTCLLKKPVYLNSDGFLTVSKTGGYKANYDSDGNLIDDGSKAVTLHIWAEKFSGYEFGVTIYNTTSMDQIYITADGEYIPSVDGNEELDEMCSALIEEYRDEIDKLLEIAHEVWGDKIKD